MKPTAEQWRQRALQDEARRALWLRLDDPGDLPGLRPNDRDYLKSILRKAGERSHRWRPTWKQQWALDRMADRLAGAGPAPVEADIGRLSDWPVIPDWERSVRRIVACAAGAT